MTCLNCRALEKRVRELEEEVERHREKERAALDLMMKGEAERERLLFRAIAGGAFDKKAE